MRRCLVRQLIRWRVDRNAEAIEQKQARITGTCAPGSAIRVIGEDGSVSCQRLPRGVVSVSALVGVPRLTLVAEQPALAAMTRLLRLVTPSWLLSRLLSDWALNQYSLMLARMSSWTLRRLKRR